MVKPARFETASEIAAHRQEPRPGVMPLESPHPDIARRVVDETRKA